MAVLRFLAVSLFFFILTIIPPALIVMIAYYIIPAQLTLMIMGGLLGLMAILAFLFYAFMFVFGVMALGLRSRTASEHIESYPENIQVFRDSLEQRGFRHLGNQYGDKFFTKEKRLNLIYLSPSGQIVAELNQNDNGEAKVTFTSIWDKGQFLFTEVDATGNTIIKNHYRYICAKNDNAVYEHHIEQLKELEGLWGKAAQIKSLEQLQQFEVAMTHTSAPDIMYTGTISVIRAFVGAAIPTLAFGALAVQGAFYLGFMPEARVIDKNAPTILFIMMSALVFVDYPLLMKNPLAAKAE